MRKVWQIEPSKISIAGKSWQPVLDDIVDNCAQGLGCLNTPVGAEFYKLLIYEPGGFFLSHRDTEKSPGMFGTLVLSLPSLHTGGDLLVRHKGQEVTIPLMSEEPSEIAYAAFHADCEHEVRPIERGYRICLIYNLIQLKKRGGKVSDSTLESPDYRKEIAEAARLLRRWFARRESTPKIVYLLDHQYSPEGLSFAGLKNKDAALADVMRHAAADADLAMHLAVVHIEESGAAEPHWDYDRYRRSRRRYWDDDEDDDEDEGEDVDFDIACQGDTEQTLTEFKNIWDEAVDFGTLPLEDGELLPADALKDEPPDWKRVTEVTGNEGASDERTYHRACLVLWPKSRFGDVLLAAGAPSALPYLDDRVSEWRNNGGAKNGADWRELKKLADRIVSKWDVGPYRGDSRDEHRVRLMELLVKNINTSRTKSICRF